MARSSQARTQKRAAVKQMKKAVERSPSPTNPLEVPHLRALEADLQQLGDAFNHNAQVHNHALTVAEMRINITQRAMNDMLRGSVYYLEADGLKSVDWGKYTEEFAMCMLMAEFAAWLKRISAPQEESGPGLVMSGYEDAVEFGGSP